MNYTLFLLERYSGLMDEHHSVIGRCIRFLCRFLIVGGEIDKANRLLQTRIKLITNRRGNEIEMLHLKAMEAMLFQYSGEFLKAKKVLHPIFNDILQHMQFSDYDKLILALRVVSVYSLTMHDGHVSLFIYIYIYIYIAYEDVTNDNRFCYVG
jgi:hypothetical protein